MMIESKASISIKFKQCPHCQVYTERIGGCKLITCKMCKTKWCWKCGLKKGNPKKGIIGSDFCIERSHSHFG